MVFTLSGSLWFPIEQLLPLLFISALLIIDVISGSSPLYLRLHKVNVGLQNTVNKPLIKRNWLKAAVE